MHELDYVIQGLWVEGALSPVEALCIRSFLAHGHAFHLYTYGEVTNVPEGTEVLDAREVLPEDRIFRYSEGFGKGSLAGFADLFRYQLLFDRGGWWVDMDVVCLRPFDFGREAIVGTNWEPTIPDNVNNCVLRSAPGDPLMEYCLKAFANMNVEQARFGETGPVLVKQGVEELELWDRLVPAATFCPVGYRDARLLVAPQWKRLINGRLKPILKGRSQVRIPKQARAIHLWNEMWRQNGLSKHENYPPSSLYERLRGRYSTGA